ncbi:MAG: EF2563 family selenium-dependent molybdenum hydroxylase system protein [Dehalococcoidales bacterium]|jgi:xanthine dehydrogenase accessory factor|nr:EF2563 family selenium-dependent molybdenum hydroxylase system protein [Dehalococcoidales bacterium]
MAVGHLKVLVRGAGEIATAMACRMAGAKFHVVMTETDHPEAVRRRVAFSEVVYDKVKVVEGYTARLVSDASEIQKCWDNDEIAVIIDPENHTKDIIKPDVEIDATIAKRNLGTKKTDAELVIGLGVGFEAGVDTHVVIETNRGHNLGRIILSGLAEPDTGTPGNIAGYTYERVLRAPCDGILETDHNLGDHVKAGDVIGYVNGQPMKTVLSGVIRGLLRNGTPVRKGLKSGDVDPRDKIEYVDTISDKGRTISGGVLEAIMAHFNK